MGTACDKICLFNHLATLFSYLCLKKLPLGLLLISPFSALAHPHAFIDMQTKPLVKDNQLMGFSTQWLLDEASSSAVLYDVKQAKGDKAAQTEN